MDIHKLIGKLPRPKKGWVLPNHRYTGPYNPLHEQLDEYDRPIRGQEPYNSVDAISMNHDICYRDHAEEKGGKHKCDDAMLDELNMLNPKTVRERIDKGLVKTLIGAKRKLGLGVEWTDALTDELHKPAKRKFEKRQVFAKNVDDIWAADLVDMQYYSRSNAGFKYILMVIDVFSKYGWAIPLKNKTGAEMVRAFRELLGSGQAPPKFLWTDKGREFDNKLFRTFLDEKKVHLYWTENEEKSCIVERWNRTIKSQMWKYFTKHRTGVYIYILPELIAKYNTTYHRSIKCTPSDARKPSNRQQVFDALYKSPRRKRKRGEEEPKFQINDQVRISKLKKKFEKGYTPNWTEEVFKVVKVQSTLPYTYKLEDARGEAVTGTFYETELQLAKVVGTYRIEKVLKRRMTPEGKREAYVKWLGYDTNFNQWIAESDIDD